MINDLIEKIAAQTGVPVAMVQPVLGSMLSHLSDILPAPVAHMVAVAMGIHQNEDQAPQSSPVQDQGGADSGLGGLLGGLLGGGLLGGHQAGGQAQAGGAGSDPLGSLLGSLLGGGNQQAGGFAGAGALASVAESLLGSLLSGKR